MATGSHTFLLCSRFSPTCSRLLDSIQLLGMDIQNRMQIVWMDHPHVREQFKSFVTTVPCMVTIEGDQKPVVLEGDAFLTKMNALIRSHTTSVPISPPMQTPAPPSVNPAPRVSQPEYHPAVTPAPTPPPQPVYMPPQHVSYPSQPPSTFGMVPQSPPESPRHTIQLPSAPPSIPMPHQQLPPAFQTSHVTFTLQPTTMQTYPMTEQVTAPQQTLQQVQQLTEHLRQQSNLKALHESQYQHPQLQHQPAPPPASFPPQSPMPPQAPPPAPMTQAPQQALPQLNPSVYQPVALPTAKPPTKSISSGRPPVPPQRPSHRNTPSRVPQTAQKIPQPAVKHQPQVQQPPPLSKPQLPPQPPHQQQAQQKLQQQVQQAQQQPQPQTSLPHREPATQHVPEDGFDEQQAPEVGSEAGTSVFDLLSLSSQPEEQGTTSLSSMFGEESLFDVYQASKKESNVMDPMQRPQGTDVRKSDFSENILDTSKRNSINQKIRAMSSDRVVQPVKGTGHESMAQSSLPTVATMNPNAARFASSSIRSTDTFALEEIDGGDDADSFILPDRPTLTLPKEEVKKKGKPSIADIAREMEKQRAK